MATPIKNFGLVTVSGTYAAGATTVSLASGHGSRLPSTSGGYTYPLTWWDATTYAHPADDPFVEIVLVTNRSTDTLTVVRGQEGTTAQNKNTAAVTYRMSLGVTKAMWDDLRVMKSTHQGLVLQTHRDALSAASKVELVACDYVAMDDGTVLRNDSGEWTGKAADITVSGAAGLDTGTEAAGRWYEVHAIAKEDGTRNLMLHLSKSWQIDTFNTTGADSYQNIRSASSNTKVSQGFQLFNSAAVMHLQLLLKKVGTPTGQITLTICANSAGVPGTTLATSYVLDVERIPTSDTPVVFAFPLSAPVLSGSTQYHLVLEGTWTINGTSYIQARMDGSAGTYAEGSKALYNGTSWTADTDDDLIFTAIVERQVSALTLPSGYTKSCLLGWVRNNFDSDFVPFLQRDRSYRAARITIDEHYSDLLDGTTQTNEWGNYLPPIPLCAAMVGVSGTGTQAGVVAVGDARATDLSSAGDTTGAQAVLYSGMTSTRPNGFSPVLVERGRVMLHGISGSRVFVVGFQW